METNRIWFCCVCFRRVIRKYRKRVHLYLSFGVGTECCVQLTQRIVAKVP